jgi:outer membrane protein TolC
VFSLLRRVVALALLVIPSLAAQDAEGFVREAVRANLGVRAADAAVRRDRHGADAAARWRIPTLGVTAQWVELEGGADVGRLVNPAFAALNQLLGTAAFPTDVTFTFPQRQDARVRLAAPLLDPSRSAATVEARGARSLQEAVRDVTARDVELGVRRALIGHARARAEAALRATILDAVREELRAAERRVAGGVATPDAVLRARADVAEAEQRLLEATQRASQARRAVNRLAQRPLDDEVPAVLPEAMAAPLPASPEEALQSALIRREERDAAAAQVQRARAGERAASAATRPVISAALDYGFQGDRWRFTRDNDLAQFTVMGSWTPFQPGRDAARRAAARAETERAMLGVADVDAELARQVADAWDAHATAVAALAPATARREAATRTWTLVRRRWDEGLASHLELVSARAAATAADLELLLARHGVADAAVALARAVGAGSPIR